MTTTVIVQNVRNHLFAFTRTSKRASAFFPTVPTLQSVDIHSCPLAQLLEIAISSSEKGKLASSLCSAHKKFITSPTLPTSVVVLLGRMQNLPRLDFWRAWNSHAIANIFLSLQVWRYCSIQSPLFAENNYFMWFWRCYQWRSMNYESICPGRVMGSWSF